MGLEHRPYIGTWRMNNRKLVQHTPDALVFFNGDTSLPGCPSCGGKIDLQPFITQVSVDSATDPSGASAQVTLAVPLHTKDQFHRNAQFVLRPGLEVHVYMRGYFPIQGQYRNTLPEETGGIDIGDVVTYPYYHTFHGVVTQVDHSYSGGFQDITMNCASMLHFWQYHNMSTNASYFGSRPNNSKLKISMVGHNFTGMTPFSIVYTLFHDTAGSAGGVAYAISDKTNVKAKSSVGGESLFSLNIRYWEERFKTRMLNLRMHGASGQLFNTAQAAFLGRLKGRQVRRLLDRQWGSKATSSKKFALLSAARSLNLLREVVDPVTGERTIQGVDVVEAEEQADPSSPKDGGVPGMEVNVASMQAFVTDIGQWGQVNLFESTYETKLDVLNKVLEITGWEFYQDVDGDFVFKPPLYNLDTRSSRIYTIKDIDIISLNFSEKEPDVTYVTCNGSQFKNLKGTGLDNEWGVRGQYIDYRLVAQFGWRPGSFETSYYSNPRSMFFAAVSRLDVLNIGVNSASCAIPLRPELRPGYPVYIEYLDCFYYLSSFNHAMVYGGQCSSNLTMTGKRAAFYAPGVRSRADSTGSGEGTQTWYKGDRGVGSTLLGQTSYPKRPLQVIGEDGFPQIVGFPNVVMALDPEQSNPLHFVAGFDLESIDNPQVLRNLITLAESYGLVVKNDDGTVSFEVDKWQTQTMDPTGEQQKQGGTSNLSTTLQGNRVFTFEELVQVSTTYVRLSTEPSKKLETNQELIKQKDESIRGKEKQIFELGKQLKADPKNAKLSSKIDALDSEVLQLGREIAELQKGIDSEQAILEQSLQQDPDVAYIRELLTAVVGEADRRTEDFAKPSETAALLDLLSDKKAIFSNGQQPGFYRYYSSAHPDPEMQGQKKLNATPGEGGSAEDHGDEIPGGRRTIQFVEPTRPGPDGAFPEAELGTGIVHRGLNILRPFAEEVQATDQIHTISFVSHRLEQKVNQTTYEYNDHYSGLSAEYQDLITGVYRNANTYADAADTMEVTWKPTWDTFTKDWDGPDFPETITFRKVEYPTATTINAAILPGSLEDPAPVLTTLREIFAAELYVRVAAELRSQWLAAASLTSYKSREEAVKAFKKTLKTAGFGKVEAKLGERTKKETQFKTRFYSPVFPVSDAGGYEVIGTYRYGRGLDIMPNATLEQLSFVDPLQFANPQDVENYLDTLMGRTPPSIGLVTEFNERTDIPPESTARLEAERRLLRSIRENPETPSSLLSELGGTPGGEGALYDNANMTNSQMSNWITRHNDGILKLPVANAAYALGDLQLHVDMKACACRAAQADILIEAFTTERFVKVLPPNVDMVSQFSADLMLEKSRPWQRFREAVTGQTMPSPAGQRVDVMGATGPSGQTQLEAELQAAQTEPAPVPVAGGGTPTANEQKLSEGESPATEAVEAATGEEIPEGTEIEGEKFGEGTEYEVSADIFGIDDSGVL